MAREQFTFCHRLRVRWAEVDMQHIVYNVNYFLYFDIAITEYWRAIGINYPDGIVKAYGTDLYTVKATAEYHRSAEYDDFLDIHGRTARLGRDEIAAAVSGCSLATTKAPGFSATAASAMRAKVAASLRAPAIDASPTVWSTMRTSGRPGGRAKPASRSAP